MPSSLHASDVPLSAASATVQPPARGFWCSAQGSSNWRHADGNFPLLTADVLVQEEPEQPEEPENDKPELEEAPEEQPAEEEQDIKETVEQTKHPLLTGQLLGAWRGQPGQSRPSTGCAVRATKRPQ